MAKLVLSYRCGKEMTFTGVKGIHFSPNREIPVDFSGSEPTHYYSTVDLIDFKMTTETHNEGFSQTTRYLDSGGSDFLSTNLYSSRR